MLLESYPHGQAPTIYVIYFICNKKYELTCVRNKFLLLAKCKLACSALNNWKFAGNFVIYESQNDQKIVWGVIPICVTILDQGPGAPYPTLHTVSHDLRSSN